VSMAVAVTWVIIIGIVVSWNMDYDKNPVYKRIGE
jgi:uncharacterized protein YggT (Ycf19 family)